MDLKECWERLAALRPQSSFNLRVELWQFVYTGGGPGSDTDEDVAPARHFETSFCFFDVPTRRSFSASDPQELWNKVQAYFQSEEYRTRLNTPYDDRVNRDWTPQATKEQP